MKLIVGLGNPGEKYEKTRHNVGFLVLDHLLQKLEKVKQTFWEPADAKALAGKGKFNALTKEVEVNGEKIVLLKPTTFMNDSGKAVQKYAHYYKIDPQDICVLHDELDLPIGKIKIRFGGSSAGHNGVSSIIEKLGTDKFLRIRLGIGKESRIQATHDSADYVLGTFAANEKGKVKTMINQAIKNILLIEKHGIDLYMSKYNK